MKCPKCLTDNPDTSRFCADCGTKLVPSEESPVFRTLTIERPEKALSPGAVLARKYKIIGLLGRGGMGVVYKADDLLLKRTVALKFLPPELTEEIEARERFLREARAAASLSHPNVCTIHEISEQNGESFIVMEYVEGQSLRKKISSGPLSQVEALGVALQAAEGLREAHKRGIIHRDIKSSNIMLSADGQAKVMDFGLAKVLGESLITKEAKTMGTVAYMSPEQVQGEVVDHRTDIWSLGVVLYEMLTGELPFGGEHEASLLYSIVHKPHPAIRKIEPKISPELEQVVEKTLAKNPADRYQSVDELLEDLRAIAEGLKPLRARVRLLKGKIFGVKKIYFYLGLVCLPILITLAILALFPGRSEALDSIAILPLRNNSGDPGQDYFAIGLTDRLISEINKVSALRVTPMQSVMGYKNSSKSPKEIARELHVKAILEASVLKSGSKVQLIARLIDPSRENTIWDHTFERDYQDILLLQSDLSQAVVSGIKIAVTPEEKELLASVRRQVNPEAYDLCLKGINLWLSQPSGSIIDHYMKIIDIFTQAVSSDPSLALAYAWLCQCYWDLIGNGLLSEKEAFPKAQAAAAKALELDEKLAEAHQQMGNIKHGLWDFSGAEKEFKKAQELAPGNLIIQWGFPVFLGAIGRFGEAVTRIKRLEKEPMLPGDLNSNLTKVYFWAGRYDEGLERAKRAANSYPGLINNMLLALGYSLKGMHAEALSIMDKIMASPGTQDDVSILDEYAWILGRSGRREDALQTMEKANALRAKNNIDSSYSMAGIYAALGDKDLAFKYLYEAYNKHSISMLFIKADPSLHNLRADPRFKDLMKKIGFAQ